MARLSAAKTQREIAAHCGVTISYICEIEHGRKEAKGEMALKMVEALK